MERIDQLEITTYIQMKQSTDRWLRGVANAILYPGKEYRLRVLIKNIDTRSNSSYVYYIHDITIKHLNFEFYNQDSTFTIPKDSKGRVDSLMGNKVDFPPDQYKSRASSAFDI